MSDTPDFGFAHLWAQGDAVTHAVAVVLIAMSVASWYWMLARLWAWRRLSGSARAIDAFWNAADQAAGLAELHRLAPDTPAARLAGAAADTVRDIDEHGARRVADGMARGELIERALRRSITTSRRSLGRGLTLLASIGATAPFVGLFGTVWGIYHALVAISTTGQATLDKVAGPVGEALIMTAAGIGVALPAVLAYNAIARFNRDTLGDLDAFAHDLHACLSPCASHGTEVRTLRVAAAKGAA